MNVGFVWVEIVVGVLVWYCCYLIWSCIENY